MTAATRARKTPARAAASFVAKRFARVAALPTGAWPVGTPSTTHNHDLFVHLWGTYKRRLRGMQSAANRRGATPQAVQARQLLAWHDQLLKWETKGFTYAEQARTLQDVPSAQTDYIEKLLGAHRHFQHALGLASRLERDHGFEYHNAFKSHLEHSLSWVAGELKRAAPQYLP